MSKTLNTEELARKIIASSLRALNESSFDANEFIWDASNAAQDDIESEFGSDEFSNIGGHEDVDKFIHSLQGADEEDVDIHAADWKHGKFGTDEPNHDHMNDEIGDLLREKEKTGPKPIDVGACRAFLLNTQREFNRNDMLVQMDTKEIMEWAKNKIIERSDIFEGHNTEGAALNLMLFLINQPSKFDKITSLKEESIKQLQDEKKKIQEILMMDGTEDDDQGVAGAAKDPFLSKVLDFLFSKNPGLHYQFKENTDGFMFDLAEALFSLRMDYNTDNWLCGLIQESLDRVQFRPAPSHMGYSSLEETGIEIYDTLEQNLKELESMATAIGHARRVHESITSKLKREKYIIEKLLNESIDLKETDQFIYSITYSIVTPESAENSEEDSSGFIVDNEKAELADIIREAESYGITQDGGRWWSSVDPSIDYTTGAETYHSLHIKTITGERLDPIHHKFISSLLLNGTTEWSEEDELDERSSMLHLNEGLDLYGIKFFEQPNGLLIKVAYPTELASDYEGKYLSVSEILEYSSYGGNGWHDLTGQVGLTGSPIIAHDIDHDETTGDPLLNDSSSIYWFPDYQVKDPWQELMQSGQVFFPKAETNNESTAPASMDVDGDGQEDQIK